MEFVSMRRMIAAFLFVGMATMLASSLVGAQDPLKHCNFFLKGFETEMPKLHICPEGDVAYSEYAGHIMHHLPNPLRPNVITNVEVRTANSDGCYISDSEDGPWNKTICANKFSTIQQWVHKRNLQDNAHWFLDMFIKIGISSAQYRYGNFNGDKSPKDCLMIKTHKDFANPDGSECYP